MYVTWLGFYFQVDVHVYAFTLISNTWIFTWKYLLQHYTISGICVILSKAGEEGGGEGAAAEEDIRQVRKNEISIPLWW